MDHNGTSYTSWLFFIGFIILSSIKPLWIIWSWTYLEVHPWVKEKLEVDNKKYYSNWNVWFMIIFSLPVFLTSSSDCLNHSIPKQKYESIKYTAIIGE